MKVNSVLGYLIFSDWNGFFFITVLYFNDMLIKVQVYTNKFNKMHIYYKFRLIKIRILCKVHKDKTCSEQNILPRYLVILVITWFLELEL